MTQFKENLSVKSIIKPGQSDSIYDHEWLDRRVTSSSCDKDHISINVVSVNRELRPIIYSATFNKSDAIAIANHFNLIPEKVQFSQKSLTAFYKKSSEYMNGELVEVVTNDDFKIGGFMTAERNDG